MKRKEIRILKPLLAVSLALALLLGVMPAAYAAETRLVGTAGDLTTALTNAADGDTIQLTANIDYSGGISIANIDITIDVQSFDLDVVNAAGAGLQVSDGGVALSRTTGSFNVTGTTSGVNAVNGSTATVTNATSTGADEVAVNASGGSTVTVLEDVTGSRAIYASIVGAPNYVYVEGDAIATGTNDRDAVYAGGGSQVSVSGDVSSALTGDGLAAFGADSYISAGSITATGTGSIGARANGGRVVVDGNAEGALYGAIAVNSGIVEITHDVTTKEAGGAGALANAGGQIIIGGSIDSAGNYVETGGFPKTTDPWDRTIPTTRLGYATYSRDTSTVWVKAPTYNFWADPTAIDSAGGDSVVAIAGIDLPGGLFMEAFDNGTPTGIAGTTSGNDTEQAVTLTFPKNDSTTADKLYTIRVSRDGGTVWEPGISASVTVAMDSGADPGLPSVTTGAVSDRTASGATLSGTVTDDCGAEVTERGFVYGLAADPAINGAGVIKVAVGSGTGNFSTALSGLTVSTTYHVRAYAINSEGVGYGGDETFTTIPGLATRPTVATNPVSDITASGAAFSGNVTAGAGVTERGFVYGNASDPAISGAGVIQVTAGSGTGSFSATISSLAASTAYHVRAYAINSTGIGYGQDIAFTTAAPDGGGGGGGGSGRRGYYAIVMKNQEQVASLPISTASGTGTVSLTGTQADGFFTAGGDMTILMPSLPGVNRYRLALPTASLSSTQEADFLTFETPAGSISIPDNMLAGLAGAEDQQAAINVGEGDQTGLTDAEKAVVGHRPIIRLILTMDGRQTDWNNPDAPVTARIPYRPEKEERQNPEAIVVWYIDGSGEPACVPSGRYDAATGTVAFSTARFSDYAVGYNEINFADLRADAWYKNAVQFCAARGIATGDGHGLFGPEAPLTRSQFIVMLLRAYGIEPDEHPADNFADAGDTWYTGYLAAAKRLGISGGVNDNLFAPEREITRQELFTLLYRTLGLVHALPGGGTGDVPANYADAGDIAGYAGNAMRALVASGVVTGSAGKLDPLGTANRAQMAQVLYRLLAK